MLKRNLLVLVMVLMVAVMASGCGPADADTNIQMPYVAPSASPTEVPTAVYDCTKIGIPSGDGSLGYNQIAQLDCYNVAVLRNLVGDSFQATITDMNVNWSDSPEYWIVETSDGVRFYLNLLDMNQEETSVQVTLTWDNDADVYAIEGRTIPLAVIYPKNPNPGP